MKWPIKSADLMGHLHVITRLVYPKQGFIPNTALQACTGIDKNPILFNATFETNHLTLSEKSACVIPDLYI